MFPKWCLAFLIGGGSLMHTQMTQHGYSSGRRFVFAGDACKGILGLTEQPFAEEKSMKSLIKKSSLVLAMGAVAYLLPPREASATTPVHCNARHVGVCSGMTQEQAVYWCMGHCWPAGLSQVSCWVDGDLDCWDAVS